ncbi:DUF1707 SHOCT-like domain-containing protein [Micromonospora sp. BQ11]|uniref:DUF1707 SHOCT-like domain-containing protein n=1 Tax=Micromonospora sp. BQ11 TaxID=3452212 RepID=UPI003F887C98
MTSPDDHGVDPSAPSPDIRIGTPERRAAEFALEVHLSEKRLDAEEFERRVEACQHASNQAELFRIFADLPAPHPAMPSSAVAPTRADQDMDIPPGVVPGCLTLGLGIPVAVVLGFAYGTWWALAVPVAVTVAMTYVEHLRQSSRRPVESSEPDPSD